MLFNSFSYLFLFLPLVAVFVEISRRAAGPRVAQANLLVASLAFYGWSRPGSLPLLAGSIVVNWAIGRAMGAGERGPRRRRVLVLGLVANVAFLGLFKYVNFFLRGLFLLGLPRFALPDWDFPLGISFFTLMQVMYLVDCYEGLIPAHGLFDHATFVGFFPYVTSGPLARSKSILGQLHDPAPAGAERSAQIARGIYQLSIGLFKKAVFADSFGHVADMGFASARACSTLEAWAFSVAYTLQIYFDFSGYSDMAIGSALVLGVEIPRNFNAPYRARTVTEFWQRWHISLSGFITTYLFTPILRSFKKATLATAAVATLVSMAIAGLWHGPSWNFILFGTLHGAALVVNQYWKKTKRRLPPPLGVILTFAFVDVTFIFFRAPDLGTALHLVRRLVPGPDALGITVLREVRSIGVAALVPPLVAGAILAFVGKSSDDMARDLRPSHATALGASMMILAACLYMNSTIVKQFVYFNF